MNTWHKESINQKIELITQEFKGLNLERITLSVFPTTECPRDAPVTQDGWLEVYLQHGSNSIYERLTYRSVHESNRGYVRHVLRTMALNLAKQYFNIPKS